MSELTSKGRSQIAAGKLAAVSAMGLPMPTQITSTGGGASLMAQRPSGPSSGETSAPRSSFDMTGSFTDRPWHAQYGEKIAYDTRHMLADALGVAGAGASRILIAPDNTLTDSLGVASSLGSTLGSMALGREVLPGLLGSAGSILGDEYGYKRGLSLAQRAGLAALGSATGRLGYRGLLALKDRMAKKKETAHASK